MECTWSLAHEINHLSVISPFWPVQGIQTNCRINYIGFSGMYLYYLIKIYFVIPFSILCMFYSDKFIKFPSNSFFIIILLRDFTVSFLIIFKDQLLDVITVIVLTGKAEWTTCMETFSKILALYYFKSIKMYYFKYFFS